MRFPSIILVILKETHLVNFNAQIKGRILNLAEKGAYCNIGSSRLNKFFFTILLKQTKKLEIFWLQMMTSLLLPSNRNNTTQNVSSNNYKNLFNNNK